MTTGRRRFGLSSPDWGQDHLTSDAIVAFVDDELAAGAQERASRHLAVCRECVAEVIAQTQARSALRSAEGPALPPSLLSVLRSIPQDADLPAPPPGLAMSADGQLVSVMRTPAPRTAGRPGSAGQRRIRLGAGAAVSGLALGALAFGAPATSTGVPALAPALDRGVLGGPLLAGSPVLEAQLSLAPPDARSAPAPAGHDEVVMWRLARTPKVLDVRGHQQ